MTIEIPEKCWKEFCDRLDSRRESMMDIRLQSSGDMQVVAQDVPLQSMVFDEKSDPCNNTIVIGFGLPGERPAQHRVIEPSRLILRRESGGDHFNLLEMPAESGMTVIIFRPGISPALLNELPISR